MSTMTTRDKWLASALPAMLTLLVGWLMFIRPASREAAILRQRVESQGSLDSRRAQVSRAEAEGADLKKDVDEKRNPSVGELGVFDRNWAVQQVSLFCDAHGLSLEKASPDPAAQLSPALRESLPAVSLHGTVPQIWRIEFSGTYPKVVKLLASLQQAKPLIVPLNLSMQAGKTERQPASWVLTLWL